MRAVKTVEPRPVADPLEAVARFVAGFSHRLKSPLTGIKGYGQLVESEDDRDRRQYWCHRLQGGLESLDLMIEGFRRYQIPDQITLQPVNLSSLVEESWELARQVTPGGVGKALVLENLLPSGEPSRLDPFHFRNLLINLFQNAIDASPPESCVRVSRIGDAELLGIEDCGPGLGDLDPDRIVEPFFTTRPDRAGLGLAVARQIAADHGLRLEWRELLPSGLRARVLMNPQSSSQRSER
jgi:signal transduction histidine kinase